MTILGVVCAVRNMLDLGEPVPGDGLPAWPGLLPAACPYPPPRPRPRPPLILRTSGRLGRDRGDDADRYSESKTSNQQHFFSASCSADYSVFAKDQVN
jgi:hypothetical protein